MLLDKLIHTFDMDVKISAKKKSGNVIACRKGDRGSLVVCYDSIVLHGYNQVILATTNHIILFVE